MTTYWPYSGETLLGDLWCTAAFEDGELAGVRVDQADPQVLISSVLLDEFHVAMPFGSLRCAGKDAGCPVGDVFAIDAVNQRLVYVVLGRYPDWPEDSGAYVAAWPD